MFTKIIDLIFKTARCPICKKIDFKTNMTEKWFHARYPEMESHRVFYHYKCREKTFNEKVCNNCNSGHWIPKPKKRRKK